LAACGIGTGDETATSEAFSETIGASVVTTLASEPTTTTGNEATATTASPASEEEIESALSLANDYIDARNEGDGAAVVALMSGDVDYEENWSHEDIAGFNEWLHTWGFEMRLECEAGEASPVLVTCTGDANNLIRIAAGDEWCDHEVLITVENALITSVEDNAIGNCSGNSDDWSRVQGWLASNYPSDYELMYDVQGVTDHSMLLTPESLELWARYIPEYAAFVSNE
jgi:hypothetical protein